MALDSLDHTHPRLPDCAPHGVGGCGVGPAPDGSLKRDLEPQLIGWTTDMYHKCEQTAWSFWCRSRLVMAVVALLYVHLTYMTTAHDKLVVRHALAPT